MVSVRCIGPNPCGRDAGQKLGVRGVDITSDLEVSVLGDHEIELDFESVIFSRDADQEAGGDHVAQDERGDHAGRRFVNELRLLGVDFVAVEVQEILEVNRFRTHVQYAEHLVFAADELAQVPAVDPRRDHVHDGDWIRADHDGIDEKCQRAEKAEHAKSEDRLLSDRQDDEPRRHVADNLDQNVGIHGDDTTRQQPL